MDGVRMHRYRSCCNAKVSADGPVTVSVVDAAGSAVGQLGWMDVLLVDDLHGTVR
jgi:hypothetical protein